MDSNNQPKFKNISLNDRGISTFEKRKSNFNWIFKQNSDICFGMISVQVPTSLCMQNKLIIHSRYCFVEQYVYPREPNIHMGNLYLQDE